ncbi:hypothetical protein L2E82_15576 [Cichorium intybus]|uniref:Uncharacterized protein n=2 Tax=Cichorium intybus TaxID=13427 RepID=A0ACB9F2S6_CICIN|nr:hypothetical protein L2E82_15575 [Cichorium intybus]KAI3765539.1 hypothetical protein L2E82_15576 [Cichorium intybus]
MFLYLFFAINESTVFCFSRWNRKLLPPPSSLYNAAAHHYHYPIRNHLPLAPPVLCLLYYPNSALHPSPQLPPPLSSPKKPLAGENHKLKAKSQNLLRVKSSVDITTLQLSRIYKVIIILA